MTYSVFIDGALAVLLVATLVHAARLVRRLDGLRRGRAEFEALIVRFTQATEQAERGMAGLKTTLADAAVGLQARIDRAAVLSDDLALLAERANGAADRLETAVAHGRGGARPAAAPTAVRGRPDDDASGDARAAPAAAGKPATPLAPATQELLRALASVR